MGGRGSRSVHAGTRRSLAPRQPPPPRKQRPRPSEERRRGRRPAPRPRPRAGRALLRVQAAALGPARPGPAGGRWWGGGSVPPGADPLLSHSGGRTAPAPRSTSPPAVALQNGLVSGARRPAPRWGRGRAGSTGPGLSPPALRPRPRPPVLAERGGGAAASPGHVPGGGSPRLSAGPQVRGGCPSPGWAGAGGSRTGCGGGPDGRTEAQLLASSPTPRRDRRLRAAPPAPRCRFPASFGPGAAAASCCSPGPWPGPSMPRCCSRHPSSVLSPAPFPGSLWLPAANLCPPHRHRGRVPQAICPCTPALGSRAGLRSPGLCGTAGLTCGPGSPQQRAGGRGPGAGPGAVGQRGGVPAAAAGERSCRASPVRALPAWGSPGPRLGHCLLLASPIRTAGVGHAARLGAPALTPPRYPLAEPEPDLEAVQLQHVVEPWRPELRDPSPSGDGGLPPPFQGYKHMTKGCRCLAPGTASSLRRHPGL